MNEAIVGIIVMAIGLIGAIFVCRSRANGSTGSGTGSDTGSVRDGIETAGRRNSDLEAAERATADRLREQAETIERTGRDNKDAQELVSKARNILSSAKRTN